MDLCEICEENEGKEYEVREWNTAIIICNDCIEENQSAYANDMRDK